MYRHEKSRAINTALKTNSLQKHTGGAFVFDCNENYQNVQPSEINFKFSCDECSRPLELYCANGVMPINGVRYLCDQHRAEFGGLR